MVWQAAEDASGSENEEIDQPPPPSVPFFRLFAYADALDWTLMILGSIMAAIHGAALPMYLYVLGGIINLFGQYQQDLNANNHQLSLDSSHSLADQLSKVNLHTPLPLFRPQWSNVAKDFLGLIRWAILILSYTRHKVTRAT